MRRRRSNDQRIFFPWESRGGFRRWLGLGRARPFLLAAVLLGFVVLVGLRERRWSGIRQTRATLLDVRRAVDVWMAHHDASCPPGLEAVVERAPTDAWGRPLRFVCPSPREGAAYELMSDGPDGEPGGLDRIE